MLDLESVGSAHSPAFSRSWCLTPALATLDAEAIEAVDRRPRDPVLAAGGNRSQGIRFGLVSQVLPLILSDAISFFDSNTRNAAVSGVVGAGGIA